MGGGVQVALAPVVATGDDLAVADDDGPDRDLALCCREPGLLEREAHEALVDGGDGSRLPGRVAARGVPCMGQTSSLLFSHRLSPVLPLWPNARRMR